MKPKRTSKTTLSEVELLILDFLALNGIADISSLYDDNYLVHMNTQYSHGLDNSELVFLIDLMVNKKLISTHDTFGKNDIRYSISYLGGKLWEIERGPKWNRYCMDSSDGNIISFYCLDVDIGKKFAETSLFSNLYLFSRNNLYLEKLNPGSLIYWKKFNCEFVWRSNLELHDANLSEIDWDLYRKNRCWWRDIEELQLFLI